MKHFILLFFTAISLSGFGQNPDFEWAQSFGGTGNEQGRGIAIDANHNVIATGEFSNTVDFDNGSGTTNLTSMGGSDIYITKQDSLGNLVWAKSMGAASADLGTDVTTDNLGNIYVTGGFQGTVDFDPGVGVNNLTSLGNHDVFVVKLNSNGTFVWAKSVGSSNQDYGTSVKVGVNGDVYIGGEFKGTTDFDPGVGVLNKSVNGGKDLFILKLDLNGNYVWVKTFGANFDDSFGTLALDAFDNIYSIGSFAGNVDFDPGSGSYYRSSNGGYDIFVSKLNASGTFEWAKSFGSSSTEYGRGITVDQNNNIIFTGTFENTVDFDAGTGNTSLTSVTAGFEDVFICKYAAAGTFEWVRSFGGTSNDVGYAVSTDHEGNVYSTGRFMGTADFNTDAGVNNITTNGQSDCFVHKLDSVGNYQWAITWGGSTADEALEIAVDARANFYVTGVFWNTVDFNPGPGVNNITSLGIRDAYVSRFSPPVLVSVQSQVNVACHGDSTGSVTVGVKDGFANYSYAWSNGQTFTNQSSATNTISALPVGNYTVTVTDNSGDTSTVSVSITEPNALVANANLVNDATCITNNDGNANVVVSGGVGTYSYAWSNGQTTATLNNVLADTYLITVTDTNMCVDTSMVIVEVGDVTAPIILTQDITVYLDTNGEVSVTPAMVDNGSTDNCAIVSLTLDSTFFDCNDLGVNTVILTGVDYMGNTGFNTATVTVVDSIMPVAVAQDLTVNLNASGFVTITGIQVDNGSSDNCSLTYSLSQWGFTCADTGVNVVTFYATDAAGNIDSAYANITVQDIISPNLTPQNYSNFLNISGFLDILPFMVTSGYTDNCGVDTVMLSQSHFTCADIGTNTVIITVVDYSGNITVDSATVTIGDNWAPQVVTQNITAYLDAVGEVTIDSNSVDNGSTDNCSIASFATDITYFNCSNLGTNNVMLTVTDVNGNVTSLGAVVTVVDTNSQIISPNFGSNLPLCNGNSDGSITTNAAGGTAPYSYNWSNGGAANAINSVASGNYQLTITDQNGCVHVESVTLSEPDSLLGSFTTVTPLCFDDTTGLLDIHVTGGAGAYTYAWSNGVTQAVNGGLTAGLYSVTVTDSNNCTLIDSMVLVNPTQITATVNVNDVWCEGDSNASAVITANGGSGSLLFEWFNLQTTDSISGLPAGTYEVVVSDTNNCMVTSSFDVTYVNPLPVVDLGGDQIFNGQTLVVLDAENAGASYVWNTGDTTQTLEVIVAQDTLVWVVVTNASGCTASDSAMLSINLASNVSELDANMFVVYPNPTSDRVFVELKEVAAGNIGIQLIDLKGSIISEEKMAQLQRGTTIDVDLSQQARGMYIIHITLAEQSFFYKVNKQ